MKTKFFYLACILLIQIAAKAQMKIGDNSTTINSGSLLELESTSKGLVFPRVSLADVASSSPLSVGLLTGTVVYNTNPSVTNGNGTGLYIWAGSVWTWLATNIASSAWSLTGNSGLNASTNFIGTTDAIDFVAKTNNVERMRILGAASLTGKPGWIGMGITTPRSSLDVTGDYTNKNVITVQNTSSTGFSSVDMLDNTGALKGTFGYANSGTGGNFASRDYFNSYGSDLLFTANSGSYHLFLKGGTGYIGINTNTPSERLHVAGNFYLNGAFMPGGNAGTSGYVLTSAGAGVSPTWTNSANFAWNLTGNAGTNYATNFLGTTDNTSLRFRTNNTEQMVIDSIGNVSIGSYGISTFNPGNTPRFSVDYGTTTSNTLAYLRGSVDSYFQINLRNKSNSPYASTDYVATADDGTDSTYYIDMGINSSTYAPSVENWGGPHDAYLYASSRNLVIGTAAGGSDVIFLVGGGKVKPNAIMRLNASDGHVIIGKGEATTSPGGTTLRGPNAQTGSINIAGGSFTVSGGSSTGTATGGNLNITGGPATSSGIGGTLNLNGGTSSSGTGGPIVFNTSNEEKMRIDALGNVGIGTTNSSYKLSVLSSSNPLYLSGVQATATFTTDSILTIYNGVIKKAPSGATLSSFSVTSPLTYNNTTGVFAINQATTSANGYLSSADWNTFNNKVGSITLNTPSPVFSNPISFSISSGVAIGTLSLNTQTANTVFAGPAAGAVATPTFRTLVAADIPSLAGLYIQNQSTLQASSNFNISGNGTIGTNFTVTGKSTLTGVTNTGTLTTSGGDVTINVNSNNTTNINSGTSTSNVTIGNSANNILFPKFNIAGGMIYTTAATGQIAGTGSNMTWDNTNSRLGIGTTSPSNKLSVLAASDPLYLSGVQATATFSTDSVLTILNGVVKKAPYSSLPSGGGSGWFLTGNSGTSAGTNFLGTIDAQPLVIKSLNRQLAYFDGNLYSIALGFGAVNGSSDHNIAIGYNALTNNQYCLALGYTATATGVRSIAIGNGAIATTASGAESIAMGYNATSSNVQSTAIGYQATASGAYGVALGYSSLASASQSTAIGYSSLASAQYSNAIGYQTQATGLQSTAIGYRAQTSQTNTILLGDVFTPNLYVGIGTSTPSAKLDIVGALGNNPLEITGLPTGISGTDNFLTINASGVVGYVSPVAVNGSYWSLTGNAATAGSFLGTTNTTPLQFKFNSTLAGHLDANNTALGTSSAATSGLSNTAIGYSSTASNSATAIGANAVASQLNNTAIGNSAIANISSQATAIGASSQALFQNNIAIGYNAQATLSSQETVIGSSAQAQGQNNIAVGYLAKANGSSQITVIGSSAQASFQNNTVIGYGALAITNNLATAIGASSQAGAQNATALGYNARATGTNSTAIGNNASTSQANALVLGDATSTVNVGIGTATPNTTTKLDVAGSFKLGSNGTVTKNLISLSSTISSTNILAQYTTTTVVFTPNVVTLNGSTNYIDVTFTLPAAATNTQATVSVSPGFDLPDDIVIAFARLTSATQGKIRFMNVGATTRTLAGTVYITVTDF